MGDIVTAKVLDFSSRNWPKVIAPYIGLVRYVGTPDAPSGKNLTRAEYAHRVAHGQPIALVYEENAGWWQDGRNAGIRAARNIVSDLTSIMGYNPFTAPPSSLLRRIPTIYAAVDKDVTDRDLPTIDAMLAGLGNTLPESPYFAGVGVYGEKLVIDHCVGVSRRARYGWQTVAWSNHETSEHAALLQQAGYVYPEGVQCDSSDVLKPDWGQNLTPVIHTNPGGTMTPDEHQMLVDIHNMYHALTNGTGPDGKPIQPSRPNLADIRTAITELSAKVDALSAQIDGH